jgi:hypothetical protein
MTIMARIERLTDPQSAIALVALEAILTGRLLDLGASGRTEFDWWTRVTPSAPQTARRLTLSAGPVGEVKS